MRKLLETDEVRKLVFKFCTVFASGAFMINSGMESYLEEFDYLFEGLGEQVSVLNLVERLDGIGERLQMILNLDETNEEKLKHW